jgi:hypothetical protein
VYVPGHKFVIDDVVCPPGLHKNVAPTVLTLEFAVPSQSPKQVTFVDVGLTVKLTAVYVIVIYP